MNFVTFVELTLLPAVLYIVWLGTEKALIEPMAKELMQMSFKRFVAPAWDELDRRLTLPGAFEDWARYGKKWVYQYAIPQEAKATLTPNQIAAFLDYLETDFKMEKHREKVNGS